MIPFADESTATLPGKVMTAEFLETVDDFLNDHYGGLRFCPVCDIRTPWNIHRLKLDERGYASLRLPLKTVVNVLECMICKCQQFQDFRLRVRAQRHARVRPNVG